ncbi:probable inactive receptor-like protein kinase At3g56050 [Dendrobium catenatum]|uniref:Putative LRR receptor-like serine/threonine-protein kinase MRH1 n=1 Tax=Dendrobium catenatum TaxID=906689 RepID=A0A2I0WHQ0_9ASPA|nr:probable inactive receptor-like protein kinase At3g56050 [Dendrobium catenatum]XP_028552514.1 probable inactive receptor-like protein kinase At3g56050 [Dendrobium catenatum]PKU75184.1 putative LRR receptor-like serine/threonine-protein kinase MRH1 [Dendrobium catenatum]
MGWFSLSWRFATLILLCWELEIAAAVSVEGKALLRLKEKLVDPFGVIADWNEEGASDPWSLCGAECTDGRVASQNADNGVARKLLQVGWKGKKQYRSNEITQKSSSSPTHFPSSQELIHQSRPSLPPLPSSAAIPLPIFLPPFPSNNVPASQPSPSPSDFLAPAPSASPTSEVPALAPIFSLNPTILAPNPSQSLPSPTISPSSVRETNQGKHTISRTVYISIIGGVSFLLALTIFFVFCCRANKVVTVRPWSTGLSGQLQKAFVTGVPSLKRSEIEIACEDFSNIIGSLPDCKFYKGTLSSGVEIAVVSTLIASSKDWSKQCESQFRKKLSTLSKVNHKNFVNLLGYCEEEEPFTRMMVFEYAPNGTLFEHLHVKEAEHLDWATRLRIAMGIAYCLDHMHQLSPPLIMKNLDSSSIYLTEDYAAKVSDIRFWVESEEAKSPPSHFSGTLEEPILEPKNTVYAFGLLLIEILSGRIPASGDVLLECWASCYLNGNRPVKEMMDPTLTFFREEDAIALCKVIRSCINPDHQERPSMSKIVNILKDITLMTPDRAVPMASPLWWAELEILTSEAN